MGLFSFFTKEIAIDLGTANTVILHNNQVVVDEPSIIALDTQTKTVKAVGKQALMMEGRTPAGIITKRPLRDGVIADFQSTELMLREFIKMTGTKGYFFTPALKMVICIPSGITEVEERAVRESAEQAGAKEVRMIHEPMAAAIGIGIDVLDANGNMVIDIGGGTSEIAVIALGGIPTSTSVKVAGDRFNSDIIDYMRKAHNIAIGVATAEQIKINVGSALEDIENPPAEYEVHGPWPTRSATAKLPRPSTAPSPRWKPPSSTPFRRPRPSCQPIFTRPASTSPAADPCSEASTNVSPTRPPCRSTSLRIPSRPWPAVPLSPSRTSTSSRS